VRQHTPTVDPRSLANFTSRKVTAIAAGPLGETPDSLAAWVERYQALAVAGVRSAGIGDKIALHLARFVAFFTTAYGHGVSVAAAEKTTLWTRRGLYHDTDVSMRLLQGGEKAPRMSPCAPISSHRSKCGQVELTRPRRGRLARRPECTVTAANTQFSAAMGAARLLNAGWGAVQRCFFGGCYRNPR